MQKTSDINVVETRALPSPAALLAEDVTEDVAEHVGEAAEALAARTAGETRVRVDAPHLTTAQPAPPG